MTYIHSGVVCLICLISTVPGVANHNYISMLAAAVIFFLLCLCVFLSIAKGEWL